MAAASLAERAQGPRGDGGEASGTSGDAKDLGIRIWIGDLREELERGRKTKLENGWGLGAKREW